MSDVNQIADQKSSVLLKHGPIEAPLFTSHKRFSAAVFVRQPWPVPYCFAPSLEISSPGPEPA